MIIIDAKGSERDWEWVKEKYNLPFIDTSPGDEDHWEVVELREIIGDMGIRIRTLDIDETPVGGIDVWVSWPDGNAQLATKAEGYVDFIMGRPAAYKPWEDEVGSISVSVWASGEKSDKITGLGWRGKTFHAHLNPTFRFVEAEKPPPSPPPPDCKEYISALERIREIVEGISPCGLEK